MNPGNFNPIWEQVKHLLFEHDCVIIPGFGGFVCNREPARIDQVSHIIIPPGKRIVFNQNIKTNDGLLAGKMAENMAVTYVEAVRQIEDFVQFLVASLQDKKQLTIDAFGSFRLNAEANYVFLPDRDNNYLYSSYGLQPIQAEYISTGYSRIKRTRIFREKKEMKKARVKTKRNLWPATLAATLTVMLLVNGWIFFKDHELSDLHLGKASLNISGWFDSIFNKHETPLEIKPAKQEVVLADTVVPRNPMVENISAETPLLDTVTKPVLGTIVDTLNPIASPAFDLAKFGEALALSRPIIYVPVYPQTVVEEPIIEQPQQIETAPKVEEETVEAVAPTGDYYIIGGVFCKKRNAVHFKSLLEQKGYHAEVLQNGGIHCERVSYASFSNRAEAERMLQQIKATENPDAWLLVNP